MVIFTYQQEARAGYLIYFHKITYQFAPKNKSKVISLIFFLF